MAYERRKRQLADVICSSSYFCPRWCKEICFCAQRRKPTWILIWSVERCAADTLPTDQSFRFERCQKLGWLLHQGNRSAGCRISVWCCLPLPTRWFDTISLLAHAGDLFAWKNIFALAVLEALGPPSASVRLASLCDNVVIVLHISRVLLFLVDISTQHGG